MTSDRAKAKSAKDYRELLRAGRWFRGLPEGLQTSLVEAATVRRLAEGERLFARGDPPSGLFVVVDGAVRITATGANGKEALLTLVVAPAWFGEIAVFDALPRTHDAIADTESVVLNVAQPRLDALLAARPEHWRDLALLMTHKLRLMFVDVEDQGALPVGIRLARRILTMAEGYGEWHDRKSRVVAVRQDQLAAMLATSRQTVNQALKKLEATGAIQLTYGEIEVRDHDQLRQLAELRDRRSRT